MSAGDNLFKYFFTKILATGPLLMKLHLVLKRPEREPTSDEITQNLKDVIIPKIAQVFGGDASDPMKTFLQPSVGDDLWTFVQPFVQDLWNATERAPGVVVGFLGHRGAGKSTMINNLLGVNMLPEGEWAATTASITEVTGWDEPFYRAYVTFVDKEEWNSFIEGFREGQDDTAELSQIFQCLSKSSIESSTQEELCEKLMFEKLDDDVKSLMQAGSWTYTSTDAEEMRKSMIPYNSSLDLDSYEKRFWPIVKRIHLFGPFSLISKYRCTILDIPGEEDGSAVMSQRFFEAVRYCSKLFYLVEATTLLQPLKYRDIARRVLNQVDFALAGIEFVLPKFGHLVKKEKQKTIVSVDDIKKRLRSSLATSCKLHALPTPPRLYFFESKDLDAELAASNDEFREVLISAAQHSMGKDLSKRQILC